MYLGNQSALTVILGFLWTLPFAYFIKARKWGDFLQVMRTNAVVKFNVIASALWFYGYNELLIMTLKMTGAVTQSVANTAKRVLIIAGGALVFWRSLATSQNRWLYYWYWRCLFVFLGRSVVWRCQARTCCCCCWRCRRQYW